MLKPKRISVSRGRWTIATPNERSQQAKDREARYSPEARSQRNKKGWKSRDMVAYSKSVARAEKRKAIKGVTIGQIIQRLSPEKRRKWLERKSAATKRVWAKRSEKDRKAIGKKISDSNKAWWETQSVQERYRLANAWLARTVEQRSAISRKARKKQMAGIAYIEKLPTVNKIDIVRRDQLLSKYLEHFMDNAAKSEKTELDIFPLRYFSARGDYEDIRQQYAFAILEALAKWNGQNLDELVNDSIIYYMMNYFTREKRYSRVVSAIETENAERLIARNSRGLKGKRKRYA